MSRLAHSTYGAPGFEKEKRSQSRRAQHEVFLAKRIQQQVGCSWTEALRLARLNTKATQP